MSTKVITPEALLSYPHFDKPQAQDDGKQPKYSGAFVFTKETLATEEGKKQFAALQVAAVQAAIDKFGHMYKLPNGQSIPIAQAFAEGILRSPFRKDALAKGYPEGSIFLNARSTQQPGCVYSYADSTGKPTKVAVEKIKEVFYAGAIVRASLAAFYYDNSGNKGVSFALNNVQFIRDGERLDGRVAAEDEFSADLAQAPADISGLI